MLSIFFTFMTNSSTKQNKFYNTKKKKKKEIGILKMNNVMHTHTTIISPFLQNAGIALNMVDSPYE